ncbi:MAG: aminoglycoside phosphotransferase family protein [Kiloniellales bacterium]
MADRAATIDRFLERAGWADARRQLLAGDASFRRYHRLMRGGRRVVLMDAPAPPERLRRAGAPLPKEEVRRFVTVARLLRRLGFSAPEVLAEDPTHGLLLLEDLGDDTYTRLLADGADEAALYRLAVDLLIALHRRFDLARDGAGVPPYDDRRLLDEAVLLVDWYMPAVFGETPAAALRQDYLAAWRSVFATARAVPQALVLRDFHIDNLMRLEDRAGVAACGLLDFQDAVIGPISYDLVSLLEDARRHVPAGLRRRMSRRYLDAFPGLDRDAFQASYAVLGAQRSAKVIGIFTRLWRRDGKPRYLAHIPRVWRWLEGDLGHPALRRMAAWFDRNLPPERRVVPASERR